MYLVFVIICLLFSSCASIINGPDQKVTILSDPSGADITINGVEAGTTPATFRIIRAKDHVIALSKEGYHVATAELTRSLSGVSVFYLLPGGLISLAIDSVDGAAFCFQDEVDVTLIPLFDPATVIASHLDFLKAVTLQERDKELSL